MKREEGIAEVRKELTGSKEEKGEKLSSLEVLEKITELTGKLINPGKKGETVIEKTGGLC